MSWNHFVGIAILLYGLTNPVGVIPIYLHLLERLPERTQGMRAHRILLIACAAVAVLLVAAAIFGKQILAFFHVGLDDFRIAGGLLALVIAFDMFQAHYGGFLQTLEERSEAESDLHSIAITPLAFPLLVGPAELSIMITLSNDQPILADKGLLVAAALLTTVLTMLTLWLAMPINRLLGRTGINVATRVMALIVASIGINFIVTGLKNQFPVLQH
jgi:multiple antibiotic resistance protein